MKSASVWTLGQIGRHTPNHARAVADTGVLLDFVTLEGDMRASEDLKGKCRKALKAILGKLTHLPTLDVLLRRCVFQCLVRQTKRGSKEVLYNYAPKAELRMKLCVRVGYTADIFFLAGWGEER